MSNLLSYSPSEVKLSLAGLFTVSGFAKESIVSLRKNTLSYRSGTTALDGYSERVFRKDDDYTLVIHLAQSSVFNDVFAAIHAVDRLTQQAKIPLYLADKSGNTKFICGNAYIASVPHVNFRANLEDREWVFHCPNSTLTLGGNETDTASTIALLAQMAGPFTSLLSAAGITL